jgi:hypothetical protein
MPPPNILNDMGALVADSEAERFESKVDDENDNVDKELGRGKRHKHPNRLYNNNTFWCHDDDNTEDSDKF